MIDTGTSCQIFYIHYVPHVSVASQLLCSFVRSKYILVLFLAAVLPSLEYNLSSEKKIAWCYTEFGK